MPTLPAFTICAVHRLPHGTSLRALRFSDSVSVQLFGALRAAAAAKIELIKLKGALETTIHGAYKPLAWNHLSVVLKLVHSLC